MDFQDFVTFYPRLAAELRHIELDAMPGYVQTPRGPRPARHVLPEVAFATVFVAAVTVWLVIGLTRWHWVESVWVPAMVTGLLVARGIGRTLRCARALLSYRRKGRR
jgi:hypothetical protein